MRIAVNHNLSFEKDIDAFIEKQLPFSIKGYYGSNTSCVEVKGGENFLLFDAGTGLRDFGNDVVQSSPTGNRFHIILSHFHWDHIQGFPFFPPAHIKGNRVDIYSIHKDLLHAVSTQQSAPFFPVLFQDMEADINLHHLEPDKEYSIAGFQVTGFEQNHPGISFGYCLKRDNKKIVYSTDCEHTADADKESYPFVQNIKNADLLIFDAQYSFLDSVQTKENWGHSSNMIGVELAIKAGVKHLCLFHTEPTQDDLSLSRTEELTRHYAVSYNKSADLMISMSYDGMVIDV